MSLKEIPIAQVLTTPYNLMNADNCFGFYDWFCADKSLERRAKSMFSKFKKISNSKKINKETSYLWFKNNYPCDGKLYDDFRISDCATGDVIYTVTPAEGYTETFGRSSVWGKENNFEKPLAEGTWQDIVTWFMKE
jgi:hypothetical protein